MRNNERLYTNGLRVFVVISCIVFCISASRAQGNPRSAVNQATHAHGDGWQNEGVKNWMAVGTLTRYRYDQQNRQTQETFPLTLLHAAGARGGGNPGDRLQRLIFQAPPTPISISTDAARPDPYAPSAIESKLGTDGNTRWHSRGPLSTQASGSEEGFIESQTVRSLEALFNAQKQGKNFSDVTVGIRGQAPSHPGHDNNGNGNAPRRGRSRPTPGYDAAKDRHVIEMSDAGSGPNRKATRFYIDDATSLVARMEFDYATGRDPISGQPQPLTEVYEFSDYRDVPVASPNPFAGSNGNKQPSATVKFPFMIERYIMGQKMETMAFHQVALNQNLRPENFRR